MCTYGHAETTPIQKQKQQQAIEAQRRLHKAINSTINYGLNNRIAEPGMDTQRLYGYIGPLDDTSYKKTGRTGMGIQRLYGYL